MADVIAPGGLDLPRLAALLARPPLFAPHDAPFWDDPHIAQGMLRAHLDPERVAASRAHATIDREVAWLVSHLGLRAGQAVLDLGCGPGLYCARLARAGLAVTGVDVSSLSLGHARRQAAAERLPIVYQQLDYRRLDRVEAFDAALLIYYDFGVLPDAERDELLRRVRRALRPGGALVLDVLTPRALAARGEARSWAVHASGFWRPGPHLELGASYWFPEAAAAARLVVVLEPDGRAVTYRLWDRGYGPTEIAPVLAAQGFRVESTWGDLTGAPWTAELDGLGVVARPVASGPT